MPSGPLFQRDCRFTIPWVCYRRRNQWLRLALALFCLPLIWLARVVYLLVGVAEGCGGCGGWRGHAYHCALTGYFQCFACSPLGGAESQA